MRGSRGVTALLVMGVSLPALLAAAVSVGDTVTLRPATCWRGTLATLGLAAPLEGFAQPILELRLARALVAACVGAALALSGGLLQGLFRNPLASPSVLGVTSGASLGATIAVIVVGGYGPTTFVTSAQAVPLVAVPLSAFIGASAVTLVVWIIGARGGSVATLLLTGIAIATLAGGCVQTLQGILLHDWDVAQAIVAWTFGTLDDRSAWHVVPVLACTLVALLCLPFLRRELDLFAFGEEDARAAGVDPRRVKITVVLLSSLLAGGAVAVAGQITFVGLIVPNLVRLLVGPRHGLLLPASALCGACFLLAVDAAQRAWLPHWDLRPGVLMSLLGAPFFLFLLARMRKEAGWW